jgi:hypothetical protein
VPSIAGTQRISGRDGPVSGAQPASRGRRDRHSTDLLAVVGTLVFLWQLFMSEISVDEGASSIPLGTGRGAGILLIAFGLAALFTGRRSRRHSILFLVLLSGVVVVNIPYLVLFYDNPPVGSYDIFSANLVKSVVLLISIFLFSLFLYDEALLIRLFRWFSLVTIFIGTVAYLASAFISTPYMTALAPTGGIRMQAFLSEPSAFAPIVAAGMILSWRNRDYWWLLASVTALVLTKSPTVLITLVVTASLYYAMCRARRSSRMTALVAMAAALALCVTVLLNVPYTEYLRSTNPATALVGRLSSGMVAITSDGAQGENERLRNGRDVVNELSQRGWLWHGYGFNSAATYFPLTSDRRVKDNSLPLNILFSHGIPGLVLFLIALLMALVGSVRSSYFPIFLAFAVTSTINSAQGFSTYQFVILGMCCYAAGDYRRKRVPKEELVAEVKRAPLSRRQVRALAR